MSGRAREGSSREARNGGCASVPTRTEPDSDSGPTNCLQVVMAVDEKAVAIANMEKGAVRLVFKQPTLTDSMAQHYAHWVNTYRCAIF